VALLECFECGKKVSTEAAACPKCGAPPPKSRKGESMTPEQSASMTYKQKRTFQKSGGKILLSKAQKFSFIVIGFFILFGLVKCNATNDVTSESVASDYQVQNALQQLDNAMKDPEKIRLLECEGIDPWKTKPNGWTPPTKNECAELNNTEKSIVEVPIMNVPVEMDALMSMSEDDRIQVSGTSNLPNNTALLVSVTNKALKYLAQDKATILNGKFSAGPFGSNGSLKLGDYTIKVTMPVSFVQPKEVQKIIGDSGQHLNGNGVVDSSFAGNVVEKTFYYTVK
jgi:hypothetical protein